MGNVRLFLPKKQLEIKTIYKPLPRAVFRHEIALRQTLGVKEGKKVFVPTLHNELSRSE